MTIRDVHVSSNPLHLFLIFDRSIGVGATLVGAVWSYDSQPLDDTMVRSGWKAMPVAFVKRDTSEEDKKAMLEHVARFYPWAKGLTPLRDQILEFEILEFEQTQMNPLVLIARN